MDIGTKKSLGIITCRRPEFYEEIMDTTPFDGIDKVYVFDSSPNEIKYVQGSDKFELIQHDGDATVGFAKNRLLERMKEDGYDHLFLQEGDVKLLSPEVFDVYIETAKHTGIWGSLNYAWHGNGNKDNGGSLIVKNSIDIENDIGLDFTHNGTAAFSYIHSKIIDRVGYHDEFYNNCWEHLDYFQKQSDMKLASYWWWFTDVKDSYKYIQDLDDGNHGGSVIRKDETWKSDMLRGMEHFNNKYKFKPVTMPEATEQQVLKRIEELITKQGVIK